MLHKLLPNDAGARLHFLQGGACDERKNAHLHAIEKPPEKGSHEGERELSTGRSVVQHAALRSRVAANELQKCPRSTERGRTMAVIRPRNAGVEWTVRARAVQLARAVRKNASRERA